MKSMARMSAAPRDMKSQPLNTDARRTHIKRRRCGRDRQSGAHGRSRNAVEEALCERHEIDGCPYLSWARCQSKQITFILDSGRVSSRHAVAVFDQIRSLIVSRATACRAHTAMLLILYPPGADKRCWVDGACRCFGVRPKKRCRRTNVSIFKVPV